MKKFLAFGIVALVMSLTSTVFAADPPAGGAAPAAAASADTGSSWVFPSGSYGANFAAAIGAGIVVLGAARGIGNIGASATESIARQPEAAKDISGAMLLSCALIEGVALFGVVVTLLVALK